MFDILFVTQQSIYIYRLVLSFGLVCGGNRVCAAVHIVYVSHPCERARGEGEKPEWTSLIKNILERYEICPNAFALYNITSRDESYYYYYYSLKIITNISPYSKPLAYRVLLQVKNI